jgi:hypothetical protein
VDLTASYLRVLPADVLERYDWAETRKAAAALAATNPDEFGELVEVLRAFAVTPARDITPAGGSESETAGHLNRQFRLLGWREGSYRLRVTSTLKRLPWAEAGEMEEETIDLEVDSTSYLVDNVKGGVALDVEWHAKDGNLDRDLASYRALHHETIIDAAVMITMTRADLRAWALRLDPQTTKFQTSTTTNLEKVRPRLVRGDGGGCPVLVASICARTS